MNVGQLLTVLKEINPELPVYFDSSEYGPCKIRHIEVDANRKYSRGDGLRNKHLSIDTAYVSLVEDDA